VRGPKGEVTEQGCFLATPVKREGEECKEENLNAALNCMHGEGNLSEGRVIGRTSSRDRQRSRLEFLFFWKPRGEGRRFYFQQKPLIRHPARGGKLGFLTVEEELREERL